MKKIFQIQFLLILLFNISCSSQKILNLGQKSEVLNVELNTIYENDKYYIFLTKENDIIESSKLGTYNLKCDKITGQVIAKQYVNPSVLGSAESFSGAPKGTGMLHEVAENALIGEMALKRESSVPIDSKATPSPIFQFAHDATSMMMPQDNILILARQNFDTVGMSVNRYWEGVAKKVDINGKIQTKSLYKVDINNKRLRK